MLSSSPRRTKTTFESELRKQNDEISRLAQERFDLRIRVHTLQKQLNGVTSPSSPGASPPTDDFYSDEKDEDGLPVGPAPPLEDNTPTIRRLRVEITDLRAENEDLNAEIDRLNELLGDLREKAAREREEVQKNLKTQHAELQTLANQCEDFQSEKLQLQIQFAQAKEEAVNLRNEADIAKTAAEESKRKERALRTRVEGYRMQYDAAVAAMDAERKKAKEATDKAGLGNVEILNLRRILEEKAAEVDGLRRDVSEITRERDVVKEGLRREKERAGIWEETASLVEKGDVLLEGGPAMESMMRVLNGQKQKYEQLHYDPQWRDMIVGDLNECLRVLYQTQREVEAKRQIVVDKFFVGDFTQKGTATPSVS